MNANHAQSEKKRISSTLLVTIHRIAVVICQLAMLAMVIFTFYMVFTNQFVYSIGGVIFTILAFVLYNQRAQLVIVEVVDNKLLVSGRFQMREFDISDVEEVSIEMGGGLPWARFKIANGDGFDNLLTLLKPKFEFITKQRYSDLDFLPGVPVRYKGRLTKHGRMINQ